MTATLIFRSNKKEEAIFLFYVWQCIVKDLIKFEKISISVKIISPPPLTRKEYQFSLSLQVKYIAVSYTHLDVYKRQA